MRRQPNRAFERVDLDGLRLGRTSDARCGCRVKGPEAVRIGTINQSKARQNDRNARPALGISPADALVALFLRPILSRQQPQQSAVDARASVSGRVRRRSREDGRDSRPAVVRAQGPDGRGDANAGRALLRGLQGFPGELPGRRRRQPVPRRPRPDRLPSHRVQPPGHARGHDRPGQPAPPPPAPVPRHAPPGRLAGPDRVDPHALRPPRPHGRPHDDVRELLERERLQGRVHLVPDQEAGGTSPEPRGYGQLHGEPGAGHPGPRRPVVQRRVPRPSPGMYVGHAQQGDTQGGHTGVRLALGGLPEDDVPPRRARGRERRGGGEVPRPRGAGDRRQPRVAGQARRGRGHRRAHPGRGGGQPRVPRLLPQAAGRRVEARRRVHRRRGPDGRGEHGDILGARAVGPGGSAGHRNVQQEDADGGVLRSARVPPRGGVPHLQHVDGRPLEDGAAPGVP
mmetsp:Transcript_25415/g.57323  ORF Transcript_25415/g.57323 Transcript_25415/m.57323 type:complete len:454 (-) Transcript_25415:510-1871(-)